jgi:ribosomal protein L36
MGWRDSLDKPSKQTIKEIHYSGKKKIERSDEHRQKLSIASRTPQEEVLQKFKQTHSDRYDYTKVEYVGRHQNVIIICKDHGEFLQRPSDHQTGSGCPKCANKNRGGVKRTTPEVIEQFKKVHSDKYDYTKVEYVGRHQHVIIICKDHGEFIQSPRIHRGGRGCPKCDHNRKIETRTRELIKQFHETHGDRYDYSKVEYVERSLKVIIICKDHGEFLQNLFDHKNGSDCPKCSYKHGRTVKRTTSEVIEQFKKVHGDRYDYSKVEYIGVRVKVIIICKDHGEFLQRVSSHIRGHNCLECYRIMSSNKLKTHSK